MARHGCGHRWPCQSVLALSVSERCTAGYTSTSLDLARKTMAAYSCGLRWSIQRSHVSYSGGRTFKVARSFAASSSTAEKTIAVLRECFARYGLPQQLVSDNGPQFCSAEFEEFLKQNGRMYKQYCITLHQNGAPEQFIQTFKQALKASTGTTSTPVGKFPPEVSHYSCHCRGNTKSVIPWKTSLNPSGFAQTKSRTASI